MTGWQQIQRIPTPFLWVTRPTFNQEEFLFSQAGAPIASWDQVWIPSAGGDQTESMSTVSAAPSALNGDVNVTGPPQSETMRTVSADPTPANDQVWIFASAQTENMSTVSAAPTPANDQIWIFGSAQTETMATVSAAPTPQNG